MKRLIAVCVMILCLVPMLSLAEQNLASMELFPTESENGKWGYVNNEGSFVITPEMFVEFAFGENYKYKNELVAYIKEHLLTTPLPNETGFEDENNNDEENQEDNEGGADA